MFDNEFKALLGAYAPQDIIVETLEISHSAFTSTFYICNYYQSFIGTVDGVDKTFLPHGFKFQFPKQTKSITDGVQITLDATDRTVWNECKKTFDTNEDIIIKWRPYILGSKVMRMTNPLTFNITALTYSNGVVTATSNFITNDLPFSSQLYTVSNFPSIRYS